MAIALPIMWHPCRLQDAPLRVSRDGALCRALPHLSCMTLCRVVLLDRAARAETTNLAFAGHSAIERHEATASITALDGAAWHDRIPQQRRSPAERRMGDAARPVCWSGPPIPLGWPQWLQQWPQLHARKQSLPVMYPIDFNQDVMSQDCRCGPAHALRLCIEQTTGSQMGASQFLCLQPQPPPAQEMPGIHIWRASCTD